MESPRNSAEGSIESLDRRLTAIWESAAARGDRMPGEPKLADSLATSRPSIREALIRLEERGYIRRRQGAETIVNTSLLGIPARFDQRVEASELIRAMGCEPQVEVLESVTSQITLEEAKEYDLPPSTHVLRITERWTADGVPVLLAIDSIPLPKGVTSADCDSTLPLAELAKSVGGSRPDWEVVWPTAELLDEQGAAWAGLTGSDPVLGLEVSGVAWSGEVCYWTKERHLRNFFRYAMVRKVDW